MSESRKDKFQMQTPPHQGLKVLQLADTKYIRTNLKCLKKKAGRIELNKSKYIIANEKENFNKQIYWSVLSQ